MPTLGVLAALVGARVRHARSRWLVVVAGLALALVLPVAGAAVRTTTADAALRRGLDGLDVGDRSVTVSYADTSVPDELDRIDGASNDALARLGGGPIRREVLFRELTDGRGSSFVLGGTDDLPGAVTLTGGRLPSSCTPARCEVVQIAPGTQAIDIAGVERSLGIVVVGTATRRDPLLVAGTFDPGPGPAVLVGDGVMTVGRLSALAHFGRSYGWAEPLDLARVRRLGVAGWAATATAAGDDLSLTSRFLAMTAPVEVLRAQDARARVSADRFGLLGGSTGILLLGVAVVGGAALRRDHEAFRGALRRRGAGRRELAVVVGGEIAVATVVAVAAGLALASAAAWVLARRAGLAARPLVGRALSAGAGPTLLLALAAATLLAVTLTVPADPRGTRSSWRAVEVGALLAAGVAVLVASRGGVGAFAGDRGGSNDSLLPALPALWLVAAALTLARLWPAGVGLAGRLVPRRSVGARLGLASAGGRPLRPVATAALLAAAIGGAVFAGAYRATLSRGAADQAAFAVPLDARVVSGRSLLRPLDVLTPTVLAGLPVQAHPVLRVAGSLRISPEQGELVQLVGVDPDALAGVARWSATVGGGDPAAVGRRIAVEGLAPGTALMPGRTLRIESPGPPITLAVTAHVRALDGREAVVELAVDPGVGSGQSLAGALPDLAGSALSLVALEIRQAPDDATRRLHALGESNVDKELPNGTIELGAVTVDDTAVASPWRGWAGSSLSVAADGATAVLPYELTSTALYLSARPDGPGTTAPLPMAVDPATAASARNGIVTIVLDRQSITGRVVATLPRFPTTSGARFAVVDVVALGRLVDLNGPGAGQPNEVWLSSRPGGGAAGSGPFSAAPLDRLTVTERAVIDRSLRNDPVARAAVGLLLASVGVMLAVAVVALVLLVHTERQDDAGQLYAWEADGVAARTLRASLWWRAVAVAVPAVPVGVVAGVALSRLTARLVAVTATATTPSPPLVPGVGVGGALATVSAGIVLALVAAAAVASFALREPMPVAPDSAVER